MERRVAEAVDEGVGSSYVPRPSSLIEYGGGTEDGADALAESFRKIRARPAPTRHLR